MITCRECGFLGLSNNQFKCNRNKDIGIVVDLDINKLDIPCHAGEPDTYKDNIWNKGDNFGIASFTWIELES